MAARTGAKKTRKKTTRRKAASQSALARLERELPKSLRDFRKQVARQLNQLEREVEKAALPARRRAAKLLREASREIGHLEAQGEKGWRQLAAPYRKELVQLVKRIERAVAPKRTSRKAGARKKASSTRKASPARKQGAARKTATAPDPEKDAPSPVEARPATARPRLDAVPPAAPSGHAGSFPGGSGLGS